MKKNRLIHQLIKKLIYQHVLLFTLNLIHVLCIVIIQVLPNYNYNYYVYLFNQNKFIEIISAINTNHEYIYFCN
jgi:type IV secretory pathway component VirB8